MKILNTVFISRYVHILGWGELNQDLVEKPAFVLQMCSKLIPCLRNDVYSCLWIPWDCLEVPETSGWRQNDVNAKLTTSTRNLSRSVWGELFWVLVGGNGHLDLIQSSYKAYSPTTLSILSTPAKDISKLFLVFEKSGSHPRYTIVWRSVTNLNRSQAPVTPRHRSIDL